MSYIGYIGVEKAKAGSPLRSAPALHKGKLRGSSTRSFRGGRRDRKIGHNVPAQGRGDGKDSGFAVDCDCNSAKSVGVVLAEAEGTVSGVFELQGDLAVIVPET